MNADGRISRCAVCFKTFGPRAAKRVKQFLEQILVQKHWHQVSVIQHKRTIQMPAPRSFECRCAAPWTSHPMSQLHAHLSLHLICSRAVPPQRRQSSRPAAAHLNLSARYTGRAQRISSRAKVRGGTERVASTAVTDEDMGDEREREILPLAHGPVITAGSMLPEN
jgi:hypothetical protein